MTDTRTRDQLKARADELGLEYAWNIGRDTLAERVGEAEAAAAANAASETAGGEQASPQVAPRPAAEVSASATRPLVIEVTGPVRGFRRCNRRFGPKPTVIPVAELSEAEALRLVNEPMLRTFTREAEPGEI